MILHIVYIYIYIYVSPRDAKREHREAKIVMYFKETHGKQNERPTSDEIAAATPGTDVAKEPHFQVYRKLPEGSHLETLPATSRHADPMEFPLLFPLGDSGWCPGLETLYQFNPPKTKAKPKKPENYDEYDEQEEEENKGLKISMRQFYSSFLAPHREFSLLHSSGRLFQQYAVVQAVKIQNNRLNWLRQNQSNLRVETYQGLSDHLKSKADRHLRQSDYCGASQSRQVGDSSVELCGLSALPAAEVSGCDCDGPRIRQPRSLHHLHVQSELEGNHRKHPGISIETGPIRPDMSRIRGEAQGVHQGDRRRRDLWESRGLLRYGRVPEARPSAHAFAAHIGSGVQTPDRRADRQVDLRRDPRSRQVSRCCMPSARSL